MNKYSLSIHGGAGTILKTKITSKEEAAYRKALETALKTGQQILKNGGKSIDAVEAVVVALEDCPLFNAGKGSVFDSDGKHEMEASMMDGKSLQAGSVAGIRNVRNPVSLARKILESERLVFLNGQGAEKFAENHDLEIVTPEYFFTEQRHQQWQKAAKDKAVMLDHSGSDKYGTVGAVAMDSEGNLAAATSTGGLTNKMYGRIGDSAVIGAGNYANNKTCAISCTGYGEYFLRSVAAYDISCLVEYKGMPLAEAMKFFFHQKLLKLGGEGGAIGIDSNGEIVMEFNSEGMYRGSVGSGDEKIKVAIFKE